MRKVSARAVLCRAKGRVEGKKSRARGGGDVPDTSERCRVAAARTYLACANEKLSPQTHIQFIYLLIQYLFIVKDYETFNNRDRCIDYWIVNVEVQVHFCADFAEIKLTLRSIEFFVRSWDKCYSRSQAAVRIESIGIRNPATIPSKHCVECVQCSFQVLCFVENRLTSLKRNRNE